MCVNIGHGDERVIRAIQEQAATLAYANPFMATEPRARLGAKLAEITPGDIDAFFFTNGGAEANENAIKIARWYTGRHKILARSIARITAAPRERSRSPAIRGAGRRSRASPASCTCCNPYHGVQRGWDTADDALAYLEEIDPARRAQTRSPASSSSRSSAPTASSCRPTAISRACARCATSTAS